MVQDLEAGPTTSVTAFGDRLAEAVERKRSQLLVGLDPMPELLPLELAGEAGLGRSEAADACARFCRGVIDAVAAYAVGVKPQLAFFEALGPPGMEALENVCAYAHTAGLIVVADAKRGDIGSTARAYASAYLEGGEGRQPIADAMTVNPYLGLDSLATHPRAVGEARRLLPRAVLLLPGIGAQGAGPADVARAFTSGPASALVAASRSVIYAFRSTDDDWRAAAAAEAARLKSEVWAASGW
jgi:orotidine-5'-phosphate decarboxylase